MKKISKEKPAKNKLRKAKMNGLNNFWFFAFIFFMALIPVSVMVLQIAGVINTPFDSEQYQSTLGVLVGVISALVMSTVTILSIAISIKKDKTFGVNNSEFDKLRIGFRFSFLWMIVISVIISTLNVAALIFSYGVSCIVFSFVSIMFLVYFCFQEMPLLLGNENRIWSIIKKRLRYEIENSAYEIEATDELKTILNNVLAYLLFKKAIKTCYKKLCYKGKDNKDRNAQILNRLLDVQNNNLFEIKNKDINILSLEKSDAEFSVIQLYDSVIRNIKTILNFSNDFNMVAILTDTSFYHITRSLFAMVENKIGIDLSENLLHLFDSYVFYPLSHDRALDGRKRRFLFGILTAMLSHSVHDGKDWFLKILREYYTGNSYGLSEYPNTYEFFIVTCWFLYYCQRPASPTSASVKDKVKGFIEDSDRNNLIRDNLFESMCWKELYDRADEWHKNSGCLNMKTLLEIHGVNSYGWKRSTAGVGHVYNLSDLPEQSSLLDWCFEMLFSSEYIYFVDFIKLFKDCDETEKQSIARYLKQSWIGRNNEIIVNKEPEGQKIFQEDRGIGAHINEQENVMQLVSWVDETLKKALQEETAEVDDGALTGIKENMVSAVKTKSQKLFGFNSDISLADEPSRQLSYACYKSQNDSYANAVINSFVKSVPDYIREHINGLKLPKTKLSGEREITSAVNKLVKLNPELCTDWTLTWYNVRLSETSQKKLDQIQCKEIHLYSLLPRYCFLKKKAFMFNFEIDETESQVRFLTDDEINLTIDRRFKREDGQYFYSDYNSNIFMSREELYGIIKQNHFIMQLTFKIKIALDQSKIIIMQKKD